MNILTDAADRYKNTPVYAVYGGLHLFADSDEQINWTADRMKGFGVASSLFRSQ